ncbi:MAG: broad specificity phosphatase PhoE [Limisphaerales bacterium]|jgi:broad specificity phosphatase PhoE
MEIGVEPEHLSEHFGLATVNLVEEVMTEGVDRAVLLMRHSARTFDPSINDLLNKLTDHGRSLSETFGKNLPKDLYVRGYTSPPHRCVETAEKSIAAHVAAGGEAGRSRPVEALGVFYGLDQRKMWKGLSVSSGLADYIGQWFRGEVPDDAMMPPELAVQMILRVLKMKLDEAPASGRSLDLCVTHDMTVFTVRHGVGLEPVDGPTVEFLDGLILYKKDGRTLMRSHHGGEVEIP